MPYAALAPLHWYGPAMVSVVVEAEPEAPALDVRCAARIPDTGIDGGGVEPQLHVTLLVGNGFEIEAVSEVVFAPMRGSVRVNVDIDVGAQPAVSEIVAGVLDALSTQYNKPNTIGAKINSASAAGDPWGTDLSSYPAGTAGSHLAILAKINRNKTISDPVTGILTVYDDDGVTPLLTAQLYKDAAGTENYSGTGVERRERLA